MNRAIVRTFTRAFLLAVLPLASWPTEAQPAPKAPKSTAAKPARPATPRTLPDLQLLAPGRPSAIDLGDYYVGLAEVTALAPAVRELPVRAQVEVTTSSFDARRTVVQAQIGRVPAQPERALLRAALRFEDGTTDTAILALHAPALPLTPFIFKPAHPGVHEVQLIGTFNGFDPAATLLHGPLLDGTFRAELPLPPGTYSYEFLADGEPAPDRFNPPATPRDYSKLTVPAARRPAPRLLPVPRFDAPASGTARLMLDSPLDLTAVYALAGNRLAPVAAHIEGNAVTLSGLPQAAALARERTLRVLALAESGEWAEATLNLGEPQGLIYQIVTDRFADGDPGNNRPLRAAYPDLAAALDWRGGDWAGLRARIEAGYFEPLGVGTITLSPPDRQTDNAEPCAALDGARSSAFRGAWPVSNEETEPRFGSPEALRALVDAAHKRGLRVLLELNADHIHWDHAWRRRWPEYINKLKAPSGDDNVRAADAPRTTWLEAFLPDIDYDQDPDATAKMVDAALGWLRRSGADGFRHTQPGRVAPEFWRTLTRRLEAEGAGRRLPYVQLAEGEPPRPLPPPQSGAPAPPADLWQQSTLLKPMITSLALPRDGFLALAEALAAAYDPAGGLAPFMPAPPAEAVAFPDLPRLIGFAGDARSTAGLQAQGLALGLFYTLPGSPLLLYGEEVGLGGGGPGDLRMMRFGENLDPGQRALLREVHAAAALRAAHPSLARGILQPLGSGADWLAYARIGIGTPGEDQALIIVVNRGTRQSVELALPANLSHAQAAHKITAEHPEAFPIQHGFLPILLAEKAVSVFELR